MLPTNHVIALFREAVSQKQRQGNPKIQRHAGASLDESLLADLNRLIPLGVMFRRLLFGCLSSKPSSIPAGKVGQLQLGIEIAQGRVGGIGKNLESNNKRVGKALGSIQSVRHAQPDKMPQVQRIGSDTSLTHACSLTEEARRQEPGKGSNAPRLNLLPNATSCIILEHRGPPDQKRFVTSVLCQEDRDPFNTSLVPLG